MGMAGGGRLLLSNVAFQLIRLHREAGVSVVVVEHVAYHLVEHREQRAERPEASEVHDVFQIPHHHAVKSEVQLHDVGIVALDKNPGQRTR